jgi:hypothetical protein
MPTIASTATRQTAARHAIVRCEIMRPHYKLITLICFTFAILACQSKEYGDISKESKISHLVGKTYGSTKPLFIYGIRTEMSHRKIVAYHTIMETSIAGPEVLSTNVLPKGTRVRVLRIERCTNCFPFPADVRLVVDLLSTPQFKNSTVVIDLSRIDIQKTDTFIEDRGP